MHYYCLSFIFTKLNKIINWKTFKKAIFANQNKQKNG